MTSNRHIAARLAKRWSGADRAQENIPEEPLAKDWLTSLRSVLGRNPDGSQAFSEPLLGTKYGYDPSFGSLPPDLGPQVTRALGRGNQTPDEIQNELNTTTQRVQGTTTVAAGPEPAGFGGSGDTGTKSYQLGHAPGAGATTLAAPVAAPPLAPSTTPSEGVAGRIAPPGGGNQAPAPSPLPKPPILAGS